jgi:4-hydroxy-tetrahydrodipicolinate synthase
MRPPLVELDAAQRHDLQTGLSQIGFEVPGAASLAER